MKKKYEMIIEYIDKLIELNKIKQGERLPPIRTLVTKFKCNKSTVIRAYTELEMNHKVYSIPKSGYYLVEKNDVCNVENSCIDFRQVVPEPKLLPYKEFNHCINRAIKLYKNNLFSYSDAQGLESLRKILVKHFINNQIFTSEENIFITSGSQQALNILTKMSFPNGNKNILVEQPTYNLIHGLVEMNGSKLIGINRNYKGIDFDELETIFRTGHVKLFYTIPRFHNPLGTSYSEKEKLRIVELAEKYNVYIVEDDYLADIDPNKKVLPMFYYDISKRVVYVKSFSKAFMPGIRIGAVVLHDELKKEFLKHKRHYDLNTSLLAQGALEIFINSGMYNNHIKKARFEYRKKMDCLRKCFKSSGVHNIDFFVPDTGFFVWIRLPKSININILVKRLIAKNIYIAQGNEFFIGCNPNENSLRLCVSNLTEETIRIGMKKLLAEINSLSIGAK